DKDGIAEQRFIFAQDLNQPFGMLIQDGHFYIGNTNALLRFEYTVGDTILKGTGKIILALPDTKPNRHWTKNIIPNKDGSKLYVAVGSSSNVAENGVNNEVRRACILEINPDGTGEKIYASGLRNPVGMAWAPGTNILWTAVNERDEIGDDLVPDYFTSVERDGFYGWPFAYFGENPDPRMKDNQNMVMVKKTIKPDVPVGSHTASLGITFYEKKAFPAKYQNGAFVTQHGSWNRSQLSGYKVIFVPFSGGKPSGAPEDFLTGFVAEPGKNDVYGRPVGITVLDDGSMLITDDTSNTIWRVASKS
ncbi:MAG: sorbosone dehydrogenase family protein, partial [Chitinophagaceae bacterium]